MIRAARHQDIEAVEAMLREMHAASKYADRCGVAPKAMRGLLEGALAMMGQRGPQASHFAIAEEGGRPVGFLIGSMSRVYSIGDKLTANDVFFIVRPGAKATHAPRLADAYIEWAKGFRACIEIMLTWSDALPGAEQVAKLFTRKGFVKSGEMFEMRLDVEAERIAA